MNCLKQLEEAHVGWGKLEPVAPPPQVSSKCCCFIYLFIYFGCAGWGFVAFEPLSMCDPSFLTRDLSNLHPLREEADLNHWTTKEVPASAS